MLEFYSIDSDNNEVHYMSLYERQNDLIIFDDKSVENTKVFLKIGNQFEIFRHGKVDMNFKFNKEKLTQGYYKNELGLEIDFVIKTIKLSFDNNIFNVIYELYYANEKISTHKITIKIL